MFLVKLQANSVYFYYILIFKLRKHSNIFSFELFLKNINPVNIYLFKAKNNNTRKRFEICPKSTTKTPEQQVSLLLKLWTCFAPSSTASIIDFKKGNVCWLDVFQEELKMDNQCFASSIKQTLEAVTRGVIQKKLLSKFCNNHRKTPVLKSPCNKVADLQACKFIKRRIKHRPANLLNRDSNTRAFLWSYCN